MQEKSRHRMWKVDQVTVKREIIVLDEEDRRQVEEIPEWLQ